MKTHLIRLAALLGQAPKEPAFDVAAIKPAGTPEFGDLSAFMYGALKSMMIAYVPD